MKLKTLKAAGFGALRELEFEFGGESSVVLGPNESGKTALVDAISCALYGPPRANSPLGRLFSARYGEKVSASASLLQSGGSALEVSAELPLQADSHPYELFRSLLVIREGECRLPDRDKRFLEAFSEKVLGAGSVDINEAMKAVRRVYSPDERHRWSHLRTELQQAAAKAAAAQLEAAEMERTAEKKRELNEKLSVLDSRMTGLEQLRRRLEAAADSQRLEKLKRAQAELATTERQLNELEGLDRSFYTRLNLLQAELTSSEKSMAEKQALATRLAKTIAENTKEQSATDKRLSELGGTGRRPRLKGACLELFRLQAELQRLSSGRNFLRFAPSAAALCAGFFAVLLLVKHDAPTTLGAAALAAAAIYFLTLKLLPGDKQRLALAALLDAAQEEFETARAAFGAAWAELDPEAALARLEEDAAEEARLLERRDMTEKILSRAESEKTEEEEKLAELKRKAGLLQMQLAADLKRYGAADVSELLAKIEKLDNLHRTREELRRSARSEAELNAATFDADLEQRIRELQRRVDDAAPEAAESAVSPAQAAEQSARARAELKKLGLEREALNRELLAESESLARLEGALGMPAAEIYLAARESQARLDDLELWRRAAEEAFQLLSGLANAGEETLKNCVENAGPVFAAMTEGRYSGLKMDSRSPFEQGGLSALHASLGEKPLEWLSAGAQDLVWLSMRIVFASSGWRTPSFMVLDEPFAALDPRRAAQALTALTRGPLAGWQIILLTKSVELAALCSAGGLKPFSLSRNDDAPENK